MRDILESFEYVKKGVERTALATLLLSGCNQTVTPAPDGRRPGNGEKPPIQETPQPTSSPRPERPAFFDIVKEAQALTPDELNTLGILPNELPLALEALSHSVVHYPSKATYFRDYKEGLRVKIKFNDLAPTKINDAKTALATGLGHYAEQINLPLTFESDEGKANTFIGFNKTLTRNTSFAETTIVGWTRYDHPKGAYVVGEKALIMIDSDFVFPLSGDFASSPPEMQSRTQESLFNLGLQISAPHEANHADGYPDDHDDDPLSFMAEGNPFRKKIMRTEKDQNGAQRLANAWPLGRDSDGAEAFACVNQYPRQKDHAYQGLRIKKYLHEKFFKDNPGTPVETLSFIDSSVNWKAWITMPD